MVELPLEIVHNIITISLPRSSYRNRDREEFLLTLCHVHSYLRRFAQRLLFSHVILHSRLSIAYFLDAVEGHSDTFDFGSCVQSFELVGWGDEVDGYLRRIIGRCKEIEEMRVINVAGLNFAQFSKLSKLRSLICLRARSITFEPNTGESTSLTSWVNLVIVGANIIPATREALFNPANLPSLRLYSGNGVSCEGTWLTFPSTLFATDLYHLTAAGAARSIILATHQLRSLDLWAAGEEGLPFPDDHRFGTPLVAIRLHHVYDRWELEQVLLDFAVKSGLIDSRTVVFFPGIAESAAESGRWKTWCLSHGVRAEWSDGQLERGWRSDDDGSLIDERSDFASWVDRRVEAGMQRSVSNGSGGV